MTIRSILPFILISLTFNGWAQVKERNTTAYVASRAPLRQNPFIELPLGAIKPQGWLREMLIRQKNGATGNLDQLYPLVMNQRNGWLGGDGDQWERGPYWLDGLLPLAYILQDTALIAKTRPWIEYAIKSQQADGYFGPSKDYSPEPGIQRDNSHDWWPKMVMLKVLQQYYNATGDKRIIYLMTRYFKYQLKELPRKPLDHWSGWARYREGDNLMVVYWLYNITGDKFLLDLANLLHKQGFDYTNAFLKTEMLSQKNSIHGVNLAQGMKEPAIYYQQHEDARYLDAIKKGYADLQKFNGMPNGMFGADESLHGNNPTQGSELCTAVEMMFSLEKTLVITGNTDYADRLEKIAFNALPAQTTDDYLNRQYFQQANQVMVTRHDRNFDINHNGTDVCYGLLTGYACCTSNMHQGWPKFTQNLWYATPDKGLAALIYSPSEVTAYVAGGNEVSFKEETAYPFEETIKFSLTKLTKGKKAFFPLALRIPAWCKKGTIKINGNTFQQVSGGRIVKIKREWKEGDVVELMLPMHLFKNSWYENSISIERGPITYALQIEQEFKEVKNDKDPLIYGGTYYEIHAASPWNYGLMEVDKGKLEDSYRMEKRSPATDYPWSLNNAPILLRAKAQRIPSWQLYNDMTGPIPYSLIYNEGQDRQKEEEIILVPYGCTKLRIAEFPVVR